MKGPRVTSGRGEWPSSTSSSLLAGLRAGEREAWDRLVRLYGPLVYCWCRQRLLPEEDAEDVVQEVFRAIARGIQEFQATPDGSFRGWLWTITRHQIADHYRRQQGQPQAAGGSEAHARLQEMPERLDDSEPELSAAAILVRRALAMIQPEFKEKSWQAFWRVVMEDQQPADVAESLGLSVNAVLIHKSRVLSRLRALLGEEGF